MAMIPVAITRKQVVSGAPGAAFRAAFFHEHRYLEVLRDKNYVSMKVSMIQENPKRVFLSLP